MGYVWSKKVRSYSVYKNTLFQINSRSLTLNISLAEELNPNESIDLRGTKWKDTSYFPPCAVRRQTLNKQCTGSIRWKRMVNPSTTKSQDFVFYICSPVYSPNICNMWIVNSTIGNSLSNGSSGLSRTIWWNLMKNVHFFILKHIGIYFTHQMYFVVIRHRTRCARQ